MTEATVATNISEEITSPTRDVAGASGLWSVLARAAHALEPLWVTALASMAMVLGIHWIPALVRLAGRGGRVETAEWLVYLLLGFAFPILVLLIGWIGPRRVSDRWFHLLFTGMGAFVLATGALFLMRSGLTAALISLFIASAVTFGWIVRQRGDGGYGRGLSRTHMATTAIVCAIAWSAAFRLASWESGAGWITQSPLTPVILILVTIAAILVFTRGDVDSPRRWRISIADIPALLVFLFLSFRTFPIAEFYHWSFWVGPIEAVRQGGWLLWDVPSQYGFLSILVPSAVPAPNGWAALYVVQGFLYMLVAVGLYVLLRSFRRNYIGYLLALAVTVTTLFFRPRTETLLLAAQMTPAGGPMRFFWPFAILAVVLWKYERGNAVSFRRFALTGTVVWVAGVGWSAESAIYCTGAWIAAYGVATVQRYSATRMTETRALRKLLTAIALPFVATGVWVGATTIVYRVVEGHGPDWTAYYEYALLFSGGYSALPIDHSGPVWYLAAMFGLVSTAGIYFIRSSPLHDRVMVIAASWGTVWSISSYFVSRSHPVNLLSLVPLLLVACLLAFHVARPLDQRWLQIARLVFIPLIAVPPALTLAHSDFVQELGRPQMSPAEIASQMPSMEKSLVSLAVQAGMTDSDPVFYVSEGKFIMPPWPIGPDKVVRTNETSWMPKPYEMIGTLPASRRDTYMNRFRERMGIGGWLIQRKADINPAYADLLDTLETSFQRVSAHENELWIIERYVPQSTLPNRP
ncbi:MAG TPA: hypothetical protein VM939_04365 [Gemmatimonadaceae bacterium]|nr:hypothetical protein [Gemmatimonadaceae bacterium]